MLLKNHPKFPKEKLVTQTNVDNRARFYGEVDYEDLRNDGYNQALCELGELEILGPIDENILKSEISTIAINDLIEGESMKNNIDEKLREVLFWHTAKIVNIEEEGGKTDNEDKEKCDIYKDTISAIKSLFPQELDEKKVTDIIEAVYAHGATTSGMDKDLPPGQMTINEAIQEIMKLQQKKVER